MPINTTALKTFAPAMRRQLLEAVGRKLDLLLHSQTPDTLSTYAKQIAELREQEAENRGQLLEKVAYTWFNRLCALRYLDARGWHPFGCKVLMPAAEGETQPELLKLMRAGDLPAGLQNHTDESRLHRVLDGQIQTAISGADPQGEVYRELVLATCRFYHELLPNLFEGLDDATELLLPDDLLTEGSITGQFRSEISDEDCQDVEIIGWLYQFYISEKKDEVMARKQAVLTEDIPAVTQLFTPHWIVRYLVENSLGRLWLLNQPSSKIKEHMPYYIEGDAETDFLVINKPEEIKLIDPACGSGHMLTYAFDLLALIYEENGYSPSEIPSLILQHNLHGLETCPRAAQLAELALIFKAREKSRRLFQPEYLIQPRIIELLDVRFAEAELREYIRALGLGDLFHQAVLRLLKQFEEAKSFGSLIQPCLKEREIADLRQTIENKELSDQLFLRKTHLKVLRILEQAEALASRYHTVVANPPYLGRRQFNEQVKSYIVEKYEPYKADLFSAFTYRASFLCLPKGYLGFMTPNVWMYISSHESLRSHLVKTQSLKSLVELPLTGFSGATVQICAFTFKNQHDSASSGFFIRLLDFKGVREMEPKTLEAIQNHECRWAFKARPQLFTQIPGTPIAYWISDSFLRLYGRKTLDDFANPRQGLATGNNDKFLRLWHEVPSAHFFPTCNSLDEVREFRAKWVPTTKGGAFRRWYGNNDYVIAFDSASYAMLSKSGNKLPSRDFYFKTGATWSTLSSGKISFRLSEFSVFETKGSICFSRGHVSVAYLLGFLNSNVTQKLLEVASPTLDYHEGPLRTLPFIPDVQAITVESTVELLVGIARADWNNFETSWNFRECPLLRPGLRGNTLQASWRNWEEQSTAAVRRMQELETENNRLFIAAYGLECELQPEVPEEQISLARAEERRDIAAFISYVVGCSMGRFSLDKPGLILANACDSLEEFFERVGKPRAEVTFAPDPDGIIPVLDGEWFEDDIVARTREFLEVTFPESTVTENLRFIEESLGKDIRKYFCSEFYKDHLQTYKKRPIYWMVQSPKKGFACLIYLHRYTKDTLNQVLNNYFRPYLQKLEARLAQLGLDQLNDSLSTRESSAARKEAEKITKVLKECQAWEQDVLLPLAQQRIQLDLDDGVKLNYLKLKDVLASIPGLAAMGD
ncbi:BREX-1 system adenine-specific DNA-methyltransferase PglX [Synechococcus sp. 8F6]|uniref:BREX-1 system adenine-specific DNA-methyltransferase PglX n=1 Tax=Synechococcus sp. 8F6 TaxID=2025606 RepID=UPI000B9870CC|nr:BREX-1 system adenine-specific DNA-methyltransferase PglX [Synechococcus sp. 8F6]